MGVIWVQKVGRDQGVVFDLGKESPLFLHEAQIEKLGSKHGAEPTHSSLCGLLPRRAAPSHNARRAAAAAVKVFRFGWRTR
jgi:hypothetical protein